MLAEIEAQYPMECDLTKAIMLDSTAPTVPAAEEEVSTEDPEGFGRVPAPEEEEHVHTEECEHE